MKVKLKTIAAAGVMACTYGIGAAPAIAQDCYQEVTREGDVDGGPATCSPVGGTGGSGGGGGRGTNPIFWSSASTDPNASTSGEATLAELIETTERR